MGVLDERRFDTRKFRNLKRKKFTNAPGSAFNPDKAASGGPVSSSARQKFFSAVSANKTAAGAGVPRTIQRGSASTSRPRKAAAGSDLFSQAEEAIKNMPTGTGGAKGKAGDVRSGTRRIKQAQALANLYSGRANLKTKEAGATGRARMADAGATQRTGMQQEGETLRSQQRNASQAQLQEGRQAFTSARDKKMAEYNASRDAQSSALRISEKKAESQLPKQHFMRQQFDDDGNQIAGTGQWATPSSGVGEEDPMAFAENAGGPEVDMSKFITAAQQEQENNATLDAADQTSANYAARKKAEEERRLKMKQYSGTVAP